MTPRERERQAHRAARMGPIYEGIGFAVILVIATLIAGPAGALTILIAGALLLVLGVVVGLVRGPVKKTRAPGDIPPPA